MRLIPKKSKVNTTIWKDFTVIDLLIVFLALCLAIVIFVSNFPTSAKWTVFIVYICVCITMFMKPDEERLYKEIVHLIKYIFATKAFGAAAKSPNKSKTTQGKNVKGGNTIDLLFPQEALEEGSIISYGEYYAGVLNVGSMEFRLLSEFEQNRHISNFAAVIDGLTYDQSMQLVKIDRPINFDDISAFTFSKILKLEELPENERNVAKLAILKSRLNQIDTVNNLEKQYRPYYYIVIYDENKGNLESTLAFIEESFAAMKLGCSRLDKKNLAVFLKYCYTRNFDEREIESLDESEYLDWVKPDGVKFFAGGAEVDGVFTFTMAAADYPLVVGNAWGADIFNQDNTKVVLNIKPLDKDKAVKRIDRAIIEVTSRENVNKASEQLGQATQTETLGNLLIDMQNGNENLYDCCLSVTGFNYPGDDRTSFKKKLRRSIASSGIKVSNLQFRQTDGYISSSITRRNNLGRYDRGINSQTLAAVFPFVFTSLIEPEGITLGAGSYPVIFDLWKRDIEKGYTNSNCFGVGKSGSGKSFFVKTLMSLLYSDNCKIFCLDPENEYSTLCANVGGKFIDVGSATSGRINPFHIYQTVIGNDDDEASYAPPDVTYYAHLRILDEFFRLTMPGINQDSLEELNNLVVKTYERRGINETTDCIGRAPEDYPVFDDLIAVVREEIAAETNPMRKTNLIRIETYVKKFADGGRNSNLWNGASTLSVEEDFVVFNFQSLLASKNSAVSNGQMLLVMHFLEQQIINIRELNRQNGTDIHFIVNIDEGYKFIDPNYPIALDFIYEWYKRVRKYGGSMIFLTQNLGDIVGNAEIVAKTSAIVNNSIYSFVFSLAPGDIETLNDIYRAIGGLNETETAEIAAGGIGKCFLLSGVANRMSFKVAAADAVVEIFSKRLTDEKIRAMAYGI